jgi:hypothetical protein
LDEAIINEGENVLETNFFQSGFLILSMKLSYFPNNIRHFIKKLVNEIENFMEIGSATEKVVQCQPLIQVI